MNIRRRISVTGVEQKNIFNIFQKFYILYLYYRILIWTSHRAAQGNRRQYLVHFQLKSSRGLFSADFECQLNA